MSYILITLFFAPIVVGLLTLFIPKKAIKTVTFISVVSFSLLSLYHLFFGSKVVSFSLPLEIPIIVFDFLLLLFFLKEGRDSGSGKVSVFAVLQLILLVVFLVIKPHLELDNIYVDSISSFMFVIINIVGGIIVFYALEYMEKEPITDFRKKIFISFLFIFLGIMNLIVSVNDIEFFFFFFEMTTLASYLLIGFRKDAISKQNAIRALWMNQIGGVFILLALILSTIFYGSYYFSDILANLDSQSTLLPLAILALAALVKGAQIPFDKWLLGAMVAPTPVSAILHSATMVKIAPFLIIKLSPALSGSSVGDAIMIIGAFVFLCAALIALSKEIFKEILAYSTISLLGLMIMLSASGSEFGIAAALILMFFHALSKALLFLEAGILEKVYHAKNLEQMRGLYSKAPKSATFILLGFLTITVPPFGAFLGKYFAIESIPTFAMQNFTLFLALICTIIGSILITVLYFKIAGTLLNRSGFEFEQKKEKLHPIYELSTTLLMSFVIIGSLFIPYLYLLFFEPLVVSFFNTNATPILLEGGLYFKIGGIPMAYIAGAALLILAPFILSYIKFKNVDRVKEYNGGERLEIRLSPYFFDIEKSYYSAFVKVSIALFVSTVVFGIMS